MPDRNPDRTPDRGPWGAGGGRGAQGLPDFDEVISRLQDKARRFVPGGPGGGGFGGGGFGGGKANRRLVALLALVGVAAWLGSGFYRVQPDQQGVVLRFGAFQRTTLPGLNYHIPWPVEQALTPAVTRINRVEVGFRGANTDRNTLVRTNARDGGVNAREVPEEALMLTGDENIIDINFSVFWRIRDAGDYLFNTRNPEETVKSAAESMMRQVIGRTPIQPALTEARARIEQDVTTGTQAILDQYKAGVEITQVQLQRVDPPAAVIDSFRDVQRANTDAERVRNEAESYRNDIIPRARGDAARLTAEADGAKQAMVAEASGQAQRFLSVYEAYTQSKDVTLKRLYIETMQEILQRTPSIVVDDKLQGIVPYLPLDPSRAAPAARPAGATR
ncbi:MAG: FtsH protease activity modulator HflK [Janthinobacterium lividum]